MPPLLGRYAGEIYSIMRFVIGLLFACHGAQKFGLFGNPPMPLLSQMGLAGVIELVGGLLIAFGLFTSIVAFIASGEMAWAYFQAHAPGGFLPLFNRGELAAVYCFVFLYMSAHGSGAWSLDRLLRRAI
jgi:putative oxidoreductase